MKVHKKCSLRFPQEVSWYYIWRWMEWRGALWTAGRVHTVLVQQTPVPTTQPGGDPCHSQSGRQIFTIFRFHSMWTSYHRHVLRQVQRRCSQTIAKKQRIEYYLVYIEVALLVPTTERVALINVNKKTTWWNIINIFRVQTASHHSQPWLDQMTQKILCGNIPSAKSSRDLPTGSVSTTNFE